MTEIVNIFDMKTHLSKHLNRLERGEVEALIVARAGKPVARLVLESKGRQPVRVGVADGRYAIPDDFDAPDVDIEQLFARDEESL